MAAPDKDQRIIEIILKAQDANASLKEMGAGAAVMAAQLGKMSKDDPGREKLLADLQLLNGRLATGRAEMRGTAQSAEELAAAEAKLAAQQLKVVVDGQKVSATFNEMTAASKQLEKDLNDLNRDDPRRQKLLADYKALGERIEEVKEEMGHAEKEGSVLTQALAFAGVTVGAEAVLDGIKELGAEIVNTTKEVAELRSNINTMTGATGAELDGLTESVLSVSRTFGKDFNEVLVASNTLSKQMGVSQQEAMRLIQQGFLAGADAGGDFLDQVKEYAPQFKNAGYAADEFIGHISQASTQGIFSDKGADVVKEFGLRIREQTKATGEAMQAAFGKDFTKEIFDGINNGTITVEQALQRVSKEMDETKIPANQLQTVIADVFGGPGEDAGIDYLKSLKNVGVGVDALVDKTNAYTARQSALLESNQELAAAQNMLTKQFEGGGTVIDTLTNKSMTVLYTLLASLGATFTELFEPVRQAWKSLTELAESMGWLSKGTLSATSAGELLGNLIHTLFTPTRLLWGVIADLVKATVEWAKSSDNARGYLQLVALPVKILFELLANGPAYFSAFSAGAETAFGSIGRAWQKVKSGDFAGAKDEFFKLGTDVASAYNKAFDAAMAKKSTVATSATTSDAGDEGPQRAQGGDGITEVDRQKAAQAAQAAREKAAREAKARQDKADQGRLDDIKNFVKNEGQLLATSSEQERARQEAANTDELKRREAQRQKILDDADQKYQALQLLEGDHTTEMAALLEERDLQLRELQAKFAEQDEQERQKALEEQLAAVESQEQEAEARLENKRANELLTEQQFQDQLYELKKQALDDQLKLLVAAGKGESEAARKLRTDMLKADSDQVKRQNDLKQSQFDFEHKMGAATAALLKDGLQLVEDNVSKQSAAYDILKAARKAAALAEIGINLNMELAYNAKNAAELGPILGVPALALMNGLSIGRAVLAGIKVAAFEKGGSTGAKGTGTLMDLARWGGVLSGASGGSFAGGGPINGPTVGLIGEAGAELVIPNWLYADPKQANLMGFLEAQIASRGNAFATGGSTTGSSAVVATDSADEEDGGPLVALLRQLVHSHQEFRSEISDWQRNLDVNLDPRKAKKAIDVATEVMTGGGIR
jgi:hypothetical protein